MHCGHVKASIYNIIVCLYPIAWLEGKDALNSWGLDNPWPRVVTVYTSSDFK